MKELPPGVSRTTVPVLGPDLLRITDPELIRTISLSPDLGRPGAAGVELPTLFRRFFDGTKFYSVPDREWALPMDGSSAPTLAARLADAKMRLQRGITDAELCALVKLVRSPTPATESERDVGIACAKLLAPLVFSMPAAKAGAKGEEGEKGVGLEELPHDVAEAAADTITEFRDMFNPRMYWEARKARLRLEEYVKCIMPDAERPIDHVHNIGAIAQGVGKAILCLRKLTSDTNPVDVLAANPVIPGAARFPIRRTTLDGLLPEDNPLVPGKSVVVLAIGDALKETKDYKFMFGTGVDERLCPFADMFVKAVEEIKER